MSGSFWETEKAKYGSNGRETGICKYKLAESVAQVYSLSKAILSRLKNYVPCLKKEKPKPPSGYSM